MTTLLKLILFLLVFCAFCTFGCKNKPICERLLDQREDEISNLYFNTKPEQNWAAEITKTDSLIKIYCDCDEKHTDTN